MQWIRSHRVLVTSAAIVAVAGLVFVIVWFEPQKLFIDERVDEELPTAFGSAPSVVTTTTVTPTTTVVPTVSTTSAGPQATTTTTTTTTLPPTTTTTAAPEPELVHESELINAGKNGSGNVLVFELPAGNSLVRFEDLDVSNGPDLFVILSAAELTSDRDAYHLAEFVIIEELKGNQGNQNYEIPPNVDFSAYNTVAIFCRRFNYTFNAATIH